MPLTFDPEIAAALAPMAESGFALRCRSKPASAIAVGIGSPRTRRQSSCAPGSLSHSTLEQ
jgi:hypothetical protein